MLSACFVVSGCDQQNHDERRASHTPAPTVVSASSPTLQSKIDNNDQTITQCVITDNMIGKVGLGQRLADLKKNVPEAQFESFVDGDGIGLVAIKFRDYEVVTPNISSDAKIELMWIDDDEKNLCQTSNGLRVGSEIIEGTRGELRINNVNRRASDSVQFLSVNNLPPAIRLASFNAADFEGESLVSTSILSKVRVDRIYVSKQKIN